MNEEKTKSRGEIMPPEKIMSDVGSFAEKAIYLELLEQRILIQSLKEELDELKSLVARKVSHE